MESASTYSERIAYAIRHADATLLGVRLGRICLAQGIPVAQVAEELGVSRKTVYAWFTGKHTILREPYRTRAVRYLARLDLDE